MYNHLMLRFKEKKKKEEYQDKMYLLRKQFKGNMDSDIVLEALKVLEAKLRGSSVECGDNE